MTQKETKSPLRNDSKTLQGTCVMVTEEEWDAPTKRKNKKRDQLRKWEEKTKTVTVHKKKIIRIGQKISTKQFFESYRDCPELQGFPIRKDFY